MADQTVAPAPQVADATTIPTAKRGGKPNAYEPLVKALKPGGQQRPAPEGSLKAIKVADEEAGRKVQGDLNKAGRDLGTPVRTRLVGNAVYVWLKPEKA